LTRARRNMARAACQCIVNGDIVSEGVLLFGLVTK
jgi:3-hydroxymyristoyl/3-hydroxydecanoyl-(acyl carrier protein) dehydratase